MRNYIIIPDADDTYQAGQIIKVGRHDMYITMILGDKVYVRHIDFWEWVGLNARKLMKKMGL